MPARWILAALLAAPAVALAGTAVATTDGPAPDPVALFETEPLFDDEAGGDADADDPAVWVHPSWRAKSLVIGTAKNAGLGVYDLRGRTLQGIAPPPAPGDDHAPGRFNNVDLLYRTSLTGATADLAVVSDRGRDTLRIYAIDPAAARAGAPPLTDVTVADPPLVFSADQDEVDEQTTAYGLATWTATGGARYVVVSRRSRTEVALLRLLPAPGGRVTYEEVDRLVLPHVFAVPGGSWTPCEDPGDLPQVEGMVVDDKRDILFAGQEDVGIWRVKVTAAGFSGVPRLIERVREFGIPGAYDAVEEECVLDEGADPGVGGRHISADVEGLTIYHLRGGRGYLLASSQGDDTFAVFDRRGLGGYVGSFAVVDGPGDLDGAQESDGAHVVGLPLGPDFPRGLLVTQDGEDTPQTLDGEGEPRDQTNFKLVPWDAVAAATGPGLDVQPWANDPRRVNGRLAR